MRLPVTALAAALALLSVAACSSSGSSSSPSGASPSPSTLVPSASTLVVGEFNPFTGPDAAFGPKWSVAAFPRSG